MTGKRNVRPRYAPLKIGQMVRLKKEVLAEVLNGGMWKGKEVVLKAKTPGKVIVPKLVNGNVVIDVFNVNSGTLSYEVDRSAIKVLAKPKPRRPLPKTPKPPGTPLPKGFDLLSAAERFSLQPMYVKQLATALANKRRAKNEMLKAIQHYADCEAICSHIRRSAAIAEKATDGT